MPLSVLRVKSAAHGGRRRTTAPGSEYQLAQLRPAFRTEDGSVTAGNASSLNDGAAAALLMSVDKARQFDTVLARIVGSAVWPASIRP